MKKVVLATVAVLVLVISVAPSFADPTGGGLQGQSANIAAGGGAYPTSLADYLRSK